MKNREAKRDVWIPKRGSWSEVISRDLASIPDLFPDGMSEKDRIGAAKKAVERGGRPRRE